MESNIHPSDVLAVGVEQHYARLGIRIIEECDFVEVLRSNRKEKSVKDFNRIYKRYLECGDFNSSQDFHRFIHTTNVPTLDATFAETFESIHRNIPYYTLPEISKFCRGASTVLDAGCGAGIGLTYLAAESPETRFVGLDLLPEAVAVARSRIESLGLSNVEVVVGDAFALPQELVGKFERVIVANVVDDSRDPFSNPLHAKFDTAHKLTEVSKAFYCRGDIWLGMTVPSLDEMTLSKPGPLKEMMRAKNPPYMMSAIRRIQFMTRVIRFMIQQSTISGLDVFEPMKDWENRVRSDIEEAKLEVVKWERVFCKRTNRVRSVSFSAAIELVATC